MAWRIHDSVIRGEIDNQQRGLVKGRLWLAGLAEPAVLELKGNAWPDLAGCKLAFENPVKTIPLRDPEGFNLRQHGVIGDLTASRKVRVFDIPLDKALERLRKKLPVPEHMANSLYLEWYSEANGRVVIESADYQLTISAPLWQLSPEEEAQRQEDAAAGLAGFMKKLTDAVEKVRHRPPEDKEWDEFDYEKLLRESDARTDKYGELLEKYTDHPDRDRIIAREMGWTWLEEELTEQEESSAPEASGANADAAGDADDDSFSDVEPADELKPDPATEGVDWINDPDWGIGHPLYVRAFKGITDFRHQCDGLGLDLGADADFDDLIAEQQITTAKLAGALNSLAYGRDLREGPFIVAYLKRALGHLQKAQAALEKVAPKNLLPPDLVQAVRAEMFYLREQILHLMQEFRGQK
jgi:hypothetical protein